MGNSPGSVSRTVLLWAGGAFLAGLVTGAALVYPGDITHPFLAAATKGQVVMHFDNRADSPITVHVTLRDAAGRTILDEAITAGPHRVTDRAVINLLAGRYVLSVQQDQAKTTQDLDVAACRGDRYLDARYLLDGTGISQDRAACVIP